MPGDGSLPGMLAEQVRSRPGCTAIVDGDGRLTFAELGERSAAVAGRLRGAGTVADDRVGVFAEPSVDLVVGVWGIVRSGGAYLPLPTDYPDERLGAMVSDGRCRLVLTQEHLAPRLARLTRGQATVVTVAEASSGRPPPRRVPDGAVSPGSLAYVIHTSGSTGEPKGVMIEHRGIASQMCWLREAQGLDERRTVLQRTPAGFDAAQWEVLAPACGSAVVVAAADVSRDPDRLVEMIRRHGITTLQCVPTLLAALVDTGALHTCTTLEQVFSGGESLSSSLALRCLDALPGCTLVNLYGPTECTINTSAFTVDRASLAGAPPHTVPIGTPVHGTRYHVLDGERRPVGDGEVGELHIGGVQLARGYLERPDLTRERFVDVPCPDGGRQRLYRSGDLVRREADGTVAFVGRVDNQVKLRGYRIELDEVRLAIERHDWVKAAAACVRHTRHDQHQELVAFVELSPREAVLMDQGRAAEHHRSKGSRLQVRAQLANAGCRDAGEVAGKLVVELPGATPTTEQWARVFARKTYRFFDGGEVSAAGILGALAAGPPLTAGVRSLAALDLDALGEILRWFGQFHSPERLLPKYGYASPGALYATQLYLELAGVAGLDPGCYYYHPVRHELVLIAPVPPSPAPRLHAHLVGKRRAIEPVYKSNVREVLEIEAGHMVGLLEAVLPAHGLAVTPLVFAPAVMGRLECASDDDYLGTFAVVPGDRAREGLAVDAYVQAHPGGVVDLPAGLYRHGAGGLRRVSDEVVPRQHVVAINQEVYERASFGVWLVSRPPETWLSYADLGRRLHRLQANGQNLGLMSSGYSSRTGSDLPAARRISDVLGDLGLATGPSYFVLGGRVSDEQVLSTGMREDTVHMRGPTEMIRDDLARVLPRYMLPNRVVVLDELPRTANGKVDLRALQTLDLGEAGADRPFVPPRTRTERVIARVWGHLLAREACSVDEDFFASGGDSLVAVALVSRINQALGCALGQQVLFEAPTIARLAQRVDRERAATSSRLVRLRARGAGRPVYVWPGLGGYPMSLRTLAARVGLDRPVYGVQAHGVNEGERPHAGLAAIAAADVTLVRACQPAGPYTLWGYSFGARIAFEVARRLEAAGERVDRLVLVAPGSPRVGAGGSPAGEPGPDRRPPYDDRAFVAVLLSVFAGCIPAPLLEACWGAARDDATFARFVSDRFAHLEAGLVRRITTVVRATYGRAADREAVALARRRVRAPVTVLRARGDERSFAEEAGACSETSVMLCDLDADHYAVLREPAVGELARRITELHR